jgi:hypothetical protein
METENGKLEKGRGEDKGKKEIRKNITKKKDEKTKEVKMDRN